MTIKNIQMENSTMSAKFALGQVVGTPGAIEALEASNQTASAFLDRHIQGDWGDLDEEDRKLNDEAIQEGSRIFSAYHTAKGVKVWVITEADRSSTCLLLPEEY
jgi:hypothetical protein